MSDAPVFDLDLATFHADPFPALAAMRARAPIAYVPQLGATLITRRNTIFAQEKRIAVFSSHQPAGLMTMLMGENFMRKDGEAHQIKRRAAFPAFAPRTVRDHWLAAFRSRTAQLLDGLAARDGCDLVRDFAMPVSGHALRHVTGLLDCSAEQIDAASQAMIDGISNDASDPAVEATCHRWTAFLDRQIDARLDAKPAPNDLSLIAVQTRAGLPAAAIRAPTPAWPLAPGRISAPARRPRAR
jgi:cytochrome P450